MKKESEQGELFDEAPAAHREPGCVFCDIIERKRPAEIIHEDDQSISFLDHRPVFLGHVLLVPKVHVVRLRDLPTELGPEFILHAQRLETAVETGLNAAGSMVLINNVVSQSVPHLHLHVIPRNRKDGLRLWLGPRHSYPKDAPASAYGDKIRAALAAL